ncbi:MAG: helix-turn-helix domain-containing protein [Bacteroidales bacterium]|jgi:hypothetical protein|nr:helix-turn-helix domain-containing protein [Bacteroidales bacterium]
MDKDQIIIASKNDLEELFNELLSKLQTPIPQRFITEKEALSRLGISSRSHLWRLRSSGKIAYTQDSDHRKIILYCSESIDKYLESNLKSTF